MRLARKLILAMVLGLAVVFAANAYYRVRRERAAFERDMRDDHAVLARVLGRAVAEVWKSSGREAAMDFIEKVDAPSSVLRLRWIDREGAKLRVSKNDLLITDVPICIGQECPGLVEVSESHAFANVYARSTLIRAAVVALIGFACAGLLTILVGTWFIGRPIQLLVDKARRIGAGDVEGPLTIRQRDEIGLLAAEMNAMCSRLAETRYALTAETEARLRAQEQLRHADRLATVGKLVSGIAHELGTPLGVALVRANMIASNPSSAPEAREAARIIGEQIDRITRIVRQLMDFARGRGTLLPGPLNRCATDLGAIARGAIAMLAPLAGKRSVTVDLVIADDAPRPPVNPEQIEQVLVNLLVNAIHASERPGQIVVTVASGKVDPPADVTPSVDSGNEQPRYALVSVKDQGVGIAAEVLPRIFEPFFTTKHVGEGTGLGLSVAYGIVREHGGWIEVTSQIKEGSCFSVYLPIEVAEFV